MPNRLESETPADGFRILETDASGNALVRRPIEDRDHDGEGGLRCRDVEDFDLRAGWVEQWVPLDEVRATVAARLERARDEFDAASINGGVAWKQRTLDALKKAKADVAALQAFAVAS